MPPPVLSELPGYNIRGGRTPVQFGGGDWQSQPQNWAHGPDPRPKVDPTGAPSSGGGGFISGAGGIGGSGSSSAPGGLSQLFAAGELAGAGATLAGAGAALVNGKLGDVGGQGMSAPPLPESSPDEWTPFGAGAAPPAPAAAAPSEKKMPGPSSSSPASSSFPAGSALVALAVLALLLS